MSNLTRRTVVTFEQTAAARDRSPEGQRNPAAEGHTVNSMARERFHRKSLEF